MAAASPIPAFAELPIAIRASVEAWRFPGVSIGSADTLMALEEWLCRHQPDPPCRLVGDKLIVPTADGVEEARKGDWIYRCQDGRLIVVRQIEHVLPWPLLEAQARSAAGAYLQELGVDPGPNPVERLISLHRTLGLRLAERCGAHPGTPLPNTDLPVPDAPRARLGGDPMRPHDGHRLPPGRYHP